MTVNLTPCTVWEAGEHAREMNAKLKGKTQQERKQMEAETRAWWAKLAAKLLTTKRG